MFWTKKKNKNYWKCSGLYALGYMTYIQNNITYSSILASACTRAHK